jgi:hypothetical protein
MQSVLIWACFALAAMAGFDWLVVSGVGHYTVEALNSVTRALP